jgi:Ca2+-binding EF-hand superfamily protein
MDFSLNQMGNAISAEDPSWQFNAVFWHALLVGEPHTGFKPLQNRTLAFWVGCFNKWQAMRTAEGLPETINAIQLQEIVFLSKGNIIGVLKLFDRAGGRRVTAEGYTVSVLSSIQISMLELLAAGVLLSRLISTNHKLRFLLSLVDVGDNGWLDESQFTSFLKCLTRGLGAVFNAPMETVPTKADINTVAQRLHSRICKLVRMSSKSSLPSIAKTSSTDNKLSHQALHDWCFGSLSGEDPLALPYRLTLERFCPTRHGDFADEFDDRLANFSLSYKCPVALPEDATFVSKRDLLERAEVLLARDIFEHGKSLGRIRITEDELQILLKNTGRREISRMTQLTFLNALEAVVEQHCRPGGGVDHIDLFDYLRQLCPKAQPKHIRMFDVWCTQYDRHMEVRDSFSNYELAAQTFIDNDKKPVLPADEIAQLENEFARLDQEGNGFVTMDDIMKGWGWSAQTALATVQAYDVLGDSFVDKDAFLRMMCPLEYKLPAMTGFAREVFGKVLLGHVESTKAVMRSVDSSYELKDAAWGGSEISRAPLLNQPPPSALPEVPEENLEQWNDVFDNLDHDDDDKVNVRDLEASGLLSTVVCYCIASLIDPEDLQGFTRAGFLTAMCKAHGYRQKLLAQ